MTAAERFEKLPMFDIRVGLERTEELAARAGNPERNLRFLHLAGTNGKGSTGAMLECALRRSGFRTGFYTSPHLVDLRERFRIDGRAVAAELLDDAADELAERSAKIGASYFEFATVLALMLFARAKVDVAVWETGMGGRLDATNIVIPAASIITNIAFDHQKYLGGTLAAIAGEKAGILKPGVPVFTGIMPEEAEAVFRRRADELGIPHFAVAAADEPQLARFAVADGRLRQCFEYDGIPVELPLLGGMQRRNFLLAAEVLKYFAPRWNFDLRRALGELRHTRWPARFQRIGERLIIDGGHNPDGIAALRAALTEMLPGEKLAVVYGAFADKEVTPSLAALAELASVFYFTPLRAEGRASRGAEELAALAASSGVPCRSAANAPEAVRAALAETRGPVLVAGSLYMAGEVLAEFAPESVFDLV